MTNGTSYATYGCLANSPLMSQIAFTNNGNWRMTTTKSYDYLNRLQTISSTPGADDALAFTYTSNDANQRTRVLLADGSYWRYEYDALGQVISGEKYWSDGTPVAGQQFEYGFDDIGNRTVGKTGGDSAGGNLRTGNYTNNFLNQLTSRGVPGFADIQGIALATATVTVNGQSTYRKGEYYRKELTVANSSSAVWQGVTNAATGQSTVTGNLYVPKAGQAFTYDADGNLTNDGRWSFEWDASRP